LIIINGILSFLKDMARKQTGLEFEAIEKREELQTKSDYVKEVNEYSADHKDAKSDGDPFGKGTGVAMGFTTLPEKDGKQNKAINYANIDTINGGGQYDAEGYNGVGGREYLKTINLYNSQNQYGIDSVDTSKNVAQGQFVVKSL
jgi:hypothetical protein